MTYEEIVLFLESLFISQGFEAKLNLKQLMDYRLSVENCPLLEELLNYYLPYSRKTQRLIWDAVWRYREEDAALLEIHDPALAGPRLLAKSWLATNYPIDETVSEDKSSAIQDLLHEIKERVCQGLHDSSLQLQYKQCQAELNSAERRTESILHQDYLLPQPPLQTLEDIRADFITYLDELSSQMPYQTAGINEMLSIKLWIDTATENDTEPCEREPLNKKSDRWGLLIETIDESRTAYSAGGSFEGKQRSCPIGFEERILDRVSLLIQASESPSELTIAQKLAQQLVAPFVEYDGQTKSFLPAQRLYECYLQAASYDILTIETSSWSLYVSPESELYQQSCQRFIEKELVAIDVKMQSYLEQLVSYSQQPLDITARVELNKIKAQLFPYIQLESSDRIELYSKVKIIESLTHLFSEKIGRIEQDSEYLATLNEEEQQIFTPLFGMHSSIAYKIQRQERLGDTTFIEELSDANIIAKMGTKIGFGPEHVRLLLAVVGQSRTTSQTAGNRHRLGGMELLEKYALEAKKLHGGELWCEDDRQEWLATATETYWRYIDEHIRDTEQVPFLSFLPDSFDRARVAEMIERYFLNPDRKLPASGALFARLYQQGAILLQTIEQKKHIFRAGIVTGAVSLLKQLADDGILEHMSEHTLQVALKTAVKYGHLGVVEILLNFSNRCLNRQDSDNYCADILITEAVSYGHAPLVDFLIGKGSNFSFTDNDNKNLVICAAENGHLEVIELLLRYDPAWDINQQDNYGRTALMYAAEQGYKKVVRYLLLKKAHINCRDIYERDVVLIVAERGHVDILQLLLQFHPQLNLNPKNSYGHTPLIIAAARGHLQIVALLLANGASLGFRDHGGRNALVAAAANRQILVVEMLLMERHFIEHINSKDQKSMTAMMHAVHAGCFEIAELLLEKGARYDILSTTNENCLFWAIAYDHGTSFLKKVFASSDFDRNIINRPMSHGVSCLKQAIDFDDIEKIELLLSYGAIWRPVNTPTQTEQAVPEYLKALRDSDFQTLWDLAQSYSASAECLEMAVKSNNSAAVNLFLSIGTPLPEAVDGQENLLMQAVKYGDKNTVLCLLPYMTDSFNYQNEEGLTVSEIAQMSGHLELAFLISEFQQDEDLPSPAQLLLLSAGRQENTPANALNL